MPDKSKNSNNTGTHGGAGGKSKSEGGKDDSKDRLDSLLDAGSESTEKTW